MAEHTDTCAHDPCTCAPRPSDAYCSDACKHAATSGPPRIETKCECGHAACAGDVYAHAHPETAAR